MAAVRWDPFGELSTMTRAMDRILRDSAGSPLLSEAGNSGRPASYLPVDVREKQNGYEIECNLPGFKPEDVEITYSEGVLSIEAQRQTERQMDDERWLQREVFQGDWVRRIALPGDVKVGEIAATFDNGVLTVAVPIAPKARPVKISVGATENQKKLQTPKSSKS